MWPAAAELAIGLLVTCVTGLFGLFWVMQRRKSASFQRDLELTSAV